MLLRKYRSKTDLDIPDGTLKLRAALIHLLWLGVPTALSFTATSLSNMLAFSFVGRQNDANAQAAHGLGFSVGNMFVLTVGYGLINGMDTLCPLVLGSGRPEGCWAHLFQALSIAAGIFPVIAPLIFFSRALLVFVKQDPVIATLASHYLMVSFPGLIFLSTFEAARKFLVYHRYTMVHTAIALISIPTQAIFLYIFVGVLQLNATGAGIARSITWCTINACIYSYIFARRENFYWRTYMCSPNNATDICKSRCTPAEEGHSQAILVSSNCLDSPSVQNSFTSEGQAERKIVISEEHEASTNLELQRDDKDALQQKSTPFTQENDDTSQKSPTHSDDRLHEDHQRSSAVDFEGKPHHSPQSRCNSVDRSMQLSSSWMKVELSSTSSRTRGPDSLVTLSIRPILRWHKHWWQGIPHFLRIAVPSMLLCIFEWISFEIQIFMAAYLGSTELSALAATSSLGALLYYVNLSVGIMLNGELGRAMGAKKPVNGHTIALAGYTASLCLSIPLAIGVFSLRSWIATVYSGIPEIQSAIHRNLLWMTFLVICDAIHAILGGEIKALNLQWYGCCFDAVCLLGIMQVVGMLLAFKTLLLGQGFIIGTLSGLSTNIVIYTLLLFWWIDWKKKSEALAGRQVKP